MKVKLTKNDLKYAEEIARKRNKSQRDGDRADGKVLKDSLAIDIQGAEAELAVAKAFKLPWDGSFLELDKWFDWRDQGHDVSGLEVRSTHYPKGCLILHPKDKDNSPFILVLTHQRPVFILAGWNIGREGKKSEYWRDVGYGRPCYYLPQKKLIAIDELTELIIRKPKTGFWQGEICKRCLRRNCIGFNVDDKIWNNVVQGRWNVLCTTCFDEEAEKCGTKYNFQEVFPVTWSSW